MVPDRSLREFLRSYPGHPSFAAAARRDVCAFASRSGFNTQDTADINAALGELLVVALQRTRGPVSGFLLSARAFGDRIEIDLQSQSARFAVSTPVRDPQLDSLAPRGVGLQIVRRLMAQVTFLDGGTKVLLVKRRSA